MFKKGDWVVENWNEAIYELKSPDYNDKDEFTPMVEKYFGYKAKKKRAQRKAEKEPLANAAKL